jgi:hypothetical protein
VADQGSTDGTREALRDTSGVQLVLNESPVFDERHRQRLLLDEARRIPGKRILIGLDADEALSANFATSPEWNRLSEAKPGTIVRFRWANILPGFQSAWIQPAYIPFGFIDDGSAHEGRTIHSPRVPQPANAPTLDIHDIVVLHFQYVLWDRMRSKQRWYQVWEHTKNRQKGALQIFREYNHMHGSWGKDEIHPVRREWLEGYDKAGIDFRGLKCESITWWDRELVRVLQKEGAGTMSKLAIWDKDWESLGRQLGVGDAGLADPRSTWEKIAPRLLAATQNNRGNWGVRGLERLLRGLGW